MSVARATRCIRTGASLLEPQSYITSSALPSTTRAAAARARSFATSSGPVTGTSHGHKVVVVGGGSAGLNVGHQLLRSGRFAAEDIAIVDPSQWHDYQPGWTLVGGGLNTNSQFRRPEADLIDKRIKFYNDGVCSFNPENKLVTLSGSGQNLAYDHLIVAPGIKIDYASIKGLPEALADPNSLVSSIYGYETSAKVFGTIQKLQKGEALFTQPSGTVKCAGAPQKLMWMAIDHWKSENRYNYISPSPIQVTFATALPGMFGVPKYSAVLDQLRQQRGVEGLFQHDLVSIDGDKATFARLDGSDKVTRRFDFLHAVPKMGPHAFVKESPLADSTGYVDVDPATMRHKTFRNVWSVGDAANLPTSKTAAAITAQAPVLVKNLLLALDDKEPAATYDGYTSCPLLTDKSRVLLAEFKYGGVPKETFAGVPGLSQGTPRRVFGMMKKYFFPWVYYNSMVKGTWAGPKGWLK